MAKKKKILQFCHSYGIPFADVARQYVALFDNSPYEVITVFLTGIKEPKVASLVGGEVIFLENTSKDVRGLKRKQIKQLKEICLLYDFAFALCHRFKPVYIANHIKGLYVIGIHHAFGDYKRLSRRWHAYRHRKTLRLLGVSDAVRDDIQKSLPKFEQSAVCTLYNRINVKEAISGLVPRKEARQILGLAAKDIVFANVGRLHPDKDQSTLLKAFAKIFKQSPYYKLMIVGTGRLEHSLKNQAKALGLQDAVIFTGKVPDVSKYFKAFDCFVLSSDREPFGMVLLEAMVAGVPVISSDCGGAPEVIGETGLLFSQGDVEQLAKHMLSRAKALVNQSLKQTEVMLARVEHKFSDESVRRQFWNLPFLKEMVN